MSDELSSSSKCDPKYLVNLTSKYEPRHEDPHFLDDSSYQVPYYLNFTNTSSQCIGAPNMGYEWDINIWNGGK